MLPFRRTNAKENLLFLIASVVYGLSTTPSMIRCVTTYMVASKALLLLWHSRAVGINGMDEANIDLIGGIRSRSLLECKQTLIVPIWMSNRAARVASFPVRGCFIARRERHRFPNKKYRMGATGYS